MTRLLDDYGPHSPGWQARRWSTRSRHPKAGVLLAEIMAAAAPPLLRGTANAEVAAALGAISSAATCSTRSTATRATRARGRRTGGFRADRPAPALGRPVGLNLEPDIDNVPAAYRATAERVAAAAEGGGAFVIVTANPARGAAIADIATAVGTVRSTAPDLVCLAGKMHHSGRTEPLGPDIVGVLGAARAHGVLVPVTGMLPGLSAATAAAMVEEAHTAGLLATGTIGTSQEGCRPPDSRAAGGDREADRRRHPPPRRRRR